MVAFNTSQESYHIATAIISRAKILLLYFLEASNYFMSRAFNSLQGQPYIKLRNLLVASLEAIIHAGVQKAKRRLLKRFEDWKPYFKAVYYSIKWGDGKILFWKMSTEENTICDCLAVLFSAGSMNFVFVSF